MVMAQEYKIRRRKPALSSGSEREQKKRRQRRLIRRSTARFPRLALLEQNNADRNAAKPKAADKCVYSTFE